MFDIRYHIASLLAVFCALGIGLLVGLGLADKGVVTKAQSNLIDNLRGDIASSREQAETAEGERDALDRYAEATLDPLIGGALSGKVVGVVSVGPFAEEVEGAVAQALE